MHLAPMRYKNYTWPHNPEVYTVEYQRRLAVHPVPYGRSMLQDLGQSYRVLRGEGVFVGETAYEQFRQLAEVFRENGPGLLVHPVWQAERVFFVSLTVTEEPLPDYVRYSFEFWEDWSGYDGGLKESDDGGSLPAASVQTDRRSGSRETSESYTVKKGDTLWAIAGRCGVTLAELIAANPQIRNPNLIYPGDEVKLP